jgi:hypothetical protein
MYQRTAWLTCRRCNGPIIKRQSAFCSLACKKASTRERKAARDRERRGRSTKRRPRKITLCRECGAALPERYTPGDPRRHCSSACRAAERERRGRRRALRAPSAAVVAIANMVDAAFPRRARGRLPRLSLLSRELHRGGRARQVLYWLLYQRPEERTGDRYSFSGVAAMLGRDHSTVHHGVNQVEAKRAFDPAFRALTDDLMARVRNGDFAIPPLPPRAKPGPNPLLMRQREKRREAAVSFGYDKPSADYLVEQNERFAAAMKRALAEER